VTLTGHSKPVQALAWSLDGKKLATASSDTTARVWTVDAHRDGKELQLKEHSESVDGVAWSPTHTDMLATASADKCIRVWDIRARKSADIKMGDEVLNVAFSPDGNYIFASDKSETLRVVDVRNNKNKVVAEACFDGQYWVNELVVNSRSDVVLMCAGRQGSVQEKGVVEVLKLNQTGDKTELQSVHKLTSHAANCTAIAIDRESRHFATGAYDGSASIWDAAELVCLRPCDPSPQIAAIGSSAPACIRQPHTARQHTPILTRPPPQVLHVTGGGYPEPVVLCRRLPHCRRLRHRLALAGPVPKRGTAFRMRCGRLVQVLISGDVARRTRCEKSSTFVRSSQATLCSRSTLKLRRVSWPGIPRSSCSRTAASARRNDRTTTVTAIAGTPRLRCPSQSRLSRAARTAWIKLPGRQRQLRCVRPGIFQRRRRALA
jgi:hypothetical protein